MTDYKLVPVEPTAEMAEAAQDAYMPFGDMNTAIMMAVLAAPAVQGEAVAWQCVWPCGGAYTTDSYESAKNYQEGAISSRGEDQAPFIRPLYTALQPTPNAPTPTFQLGDRVRKTKGSQWKGRVVGTYSTSLTPEGYAVESDTEKGSVQIYPVGALELVGDQPC